MRRRSTSSKLPSTAAPGTAGRCFVYVAPCVWEDHCKIGFSRDPLSRLRSLHRRWYDYFDLDRGLLVETESVRDARDLELELRRPLVEHRAPPPLTVREEAGGHTEWVRGAWSQLELAIPALQVRGYRVHAPLRHWLGTALRASSDPLYAWSQAQLAAAVQMEGSDAAGTLQCLLRDTLEAYPAVGVDLEPLVAPEVFRWYSGC